MLNYFLPSLEKNQAPLLAYKDYFFKVSMTKDVSPAKSIKGCMQACIKIWTLGDFLFEFCTLNRVFLPSFHINTELKYCLSSINQSCHVMSASCHVMSA